jgi:hypothetical protein
MSLRRDREAEAHVHARRVALHGRVEELGETAELHDLVEVLRDLGARHAGDGGVQVDVLAAAEVGVEAGSHLDERRDPSIGPDGARRGQVDAREELERGALAGTVRSDEADRFALSDLEAHVVHGVEPPAPRVGPAASEDRGHEVAHRILIAAAREALGHVVEPHGDRGHQARSAKSGSHREKTRNPKSRKPTAHAAPSAKWYGFEKPPERSTSR